MKGRENEKMSNSTSLREKLTKVVASATDTEGKWMMNDMDGWLVGWIFSCTCELIKSVYA